MGVIQKIKQGRLVGYVLLLLTFRGELGLEWDEVILKLLPLIIVMELYNLGMSDKSEVDEVLKDYGIEGEVHDYQRIIEEKQKKMNNKSFFKKDKHP